MSSQHHINYGHVVPVASLRPAVSPDKRSDFDNMLSGFEEGEIDTEGVDTLLRSLLPAGFPAYEGVFTTSEDDLNGGLDDDVLYIWYEESTLFNLVPKQEMLQLQGCGILPGFHAWAIWG